MSTNRFTRNELFLIIERLKKVFSVETEGKVADLLGIGKSALSQSKSRGTLPIEKIVSACSQNRINVNWLLSGTGPMFTGSGSAPLPELISSGDDAGAPSHEGTQKIDIEEAIETTRRILESEKTYSTALNGIIRALDKAVSAEEEMTGVREEMQQMRSENNERMTRMEEMLLSLGANFKKRDGQANS